MTSRTTELPTMASLPYLANGQKFMLGAARLNAQFYKAGMRYQIEMMDFLKHRFEQDIKFVDDLVASDQLNDTFDVVTDFMQNAANEYAAEAGKMATIGSKLASETARDMRKQAEDAVEDMATRTVA